MKREMICNFLQPRGFQTLKKTAWGDFERLLWVKRKSPSRRNRLINVILWFWLETSEDGKKSLTFLSPPKASFQESAPDHLKKWQLSSSSVQFIFKCLPPPLVRCKRAVWEARTLLLQPQIPGQRCLNVSIKCSWRTFILGGREE